MILTCHDCTRQLCFAEKDRASVIPGFGWANIAGSYFCAGCALALGGASSPPLNMHAANHVNHSDRGGTVVLSEPPAIVFDSPPCVHFAVPAASSLGPAP